jgi:hypothetical protein
MIVETPIDKVVKHVGGGIPFNLYIREPIVKEFIPPPIAALKIVEKAKEEEKPAKKIRKNASKARPFEKSNEWRFMRAMVLDKFGRECMCCGSLSKIQVDHIVPKSLRPDLALEMSNLQVLCWDCNRRKWTNKSTKDYRPDQLKR